MPDYDLFDHASLLGVRKNVDLGRGRDWTYLGLDRSHAPTPPPGPTLAERQDRCEQMGLVFCNCKLDNGHVIVYNPTCPVHQHYCKL